MIKQVFFCVFGVMLFGLGIVLQIQSGLGASPWDALHLGIIHYWPLSLGEISQLTGLLMIVLSWLLGIKPGWGTLVNMYFIGYFIDVFMNSGWFGTPEGWLLRLMMLVIGVLIVGWGQLFLSFCRVGSRAEGWLYGRFGNEVWPAGLAGANRD